MTEIEEKFLWASIKGDVKEAKKCIKSGVDINCQNESEESALFCASYNGNTKIVKLLLENGADIDSQDRLKHTALITAIVNGRMKVIELLLENNANLTIKDIDNTTTLDWAYIQKDETKENIYQEIIELIENTIKTRKLENAIAKLDEPVFSI